MSTRAEYVLFKDTTLDEVLSVLDAVLTECGGRRYRHGGPPDFRPTPPDYRLKTPWWYSATGSAVGICPSYDGAGTVMFLELARRFVRPWINVRIQEGALWDFAQYDGYTIVDTFSTLPEYWFEQRKQQLPWRGKPAVVAALWGVPVASIERYMLPWGMKVISDTMYETTRRGLAYPTDRYEYGDVFQCHDFVKALTGFDLSALSSDAPADILDLSNESEVKTRLNFKSPEWA